MIGTFRNEGQHGFQLLSQKSYLVLAVSFIAKKGGGQVIYQIPNDAGGISHVPANLFELSDHRCSAYWVARYEEDGSMLLWPEEFFVDYFHDDLSEGAKNASALFESALKRLMAEGNPPSN